MIIVSGPSTVGKNPLIYKACEVYGLEYIVPCTTREKRKDEKDGVDYFFLSKTDFQNRIAQNVIMQWDYALNNYYGYSFDFPGNENCITHGLSRMALRIKAKYPDKVTTVFLMPDDSTRIFNNLKNIYEGNELALRQALVKEEIVHSALFDEVFTCTSNCLDLLDDDRLKQILKK